MTTPVSGSRLARILKHRWYDEDDAARALDAAAMQRLEQRVAGSEKRHRGEIRICVEAGLPLSYLWRRATPRARAVALFGKLRVWDTELNNGVLIYLLLAERSIEIVADRGVARHVPQAMWEEILRRMRGAFRSGQFEAGLAQAVDEVHALLEAQFPLRPGDADSNELPDWVDRR
jgi:uncharacterized membrane protein